jgi:hypothetical protein
MSDDLPAAALSPDAPIHQLLSLRHNPLVKDMNPEQLRAFVQKLKEYSTSAPTLSSKLSSDSEKIKPKREKSARQKLLDDL